MELVEPINHINNQLKDHFGTDTVTGQVIWRVVFSEDQFEKQYGTFSDYTPGGLYIRTVTEVRLIPKYRQWIQEKYVLERLVVVPVINSEDLPTSKVSYEPIFPFEDKNGNYLPPKFEVAKFVIDAIYAVQYSDHSLTKYKDPDSNQENALENKKKRVEQLVKDIFGDETATSDSLARKESIIVP